MDSNPTIQIILGLVLLLIIAGIRRRLTFEIQGASMLVLGNPRVGLYIYSVIFLPGTILHELSHWIVAEILQVPTGKFEVLPDLEEQGKDKHEERLGYVMTGRTDPFRSFLIGFAPLITGICALIVLGYVLNNIWGMSPWWQIALTVYGLIVVGNSMIVSSADMRSWPVVAILASMIVGAIYYFDFSIDSRIIDLASAVLTKVNMALVLTIGLNLAMILVSYAARRGLEHVTKKRIVRGR